MGLKGTELRDSIKNSRIWREKKVISNGNMVGYSKTC